MQFVLQWLADKRAKEDEIVRQRGTYRANKVPKHIKDRNRFGQIFIFLHLTHISFFLFLKIIMYIFKIIYIYIYKLIIYADL